MVSKIYQRDETAIVWRSSTGDEVLTLTSLAAGAGQLGDEHDFGANAQARRYRPYFECKFTTPPVLGESILIFVARGDGTERDSSVGGADAALDFGSGTQDDTLNFLFLGALVVNHEDSAAIFRVFLPEFESSARFLSPAIVNQTADALSATALAMEFSLTPVPYEGQ